MTAEAFQQGLMEMYQGEVIGEVAFNDMLQFLDDPQQRYKIAVALQLETETKARLRPALISLGLDPTETAASREAGRQFAAALKGLDWPQAMAAMRDGVKPYVDRYRDVEAMAPASHRELAHSMVVHEQSLYDFADLEAAGDAAASLDAIVAQLVFPLPAPR